MQMQFTKREVALAAVALIGSMSMSVATDSAMAQGAAAGKYVAGDFHNHTTCSDGSLSMQKLVKKSTATWGLDWFVQAGHGGNGNRNCTLTEDASLGTPNFPFTGQGPTTTWANSIGAAAVKGQVGVTGIPSSTTTATTPTSNTTALNTQASPNMWRWQSLQSFQYQLMEDQAVRKSVPLFLGLESVVAGHEHTSMSVITGQMPSSIDALTNGAGVNATLGNADALAKWSYCFDRGDTDTSRGGSNNWDCSVTGSTNATDPSWNALAQKLVPLGTFAGVVNGQSTYNATGIGVQGHGKTVEAVKWMKEFHPQGSYYIPAHLERAGPFNANGNNGFDINHLRDFNNAAPGVAFGMETQPGHGASSDRGEYLPKRQTINGVLTDSVGGTTYGGTGVYGAQIGGVWDALLGEGRRFWFFASSDWHNRGVFGPDDRRSTQDFQPGEYQRNYAMVRNGTDKLRPQTIVDGLRSGNNWASSGQLIDRLSFIACTGLSEAQVQALAVAAASGSTAVDSPNCANMGEKLVVAAGSTVVVGIVVRDPAGTNNSPYSFPNPSLAQVFINQPMNAPVLHHVDLIGGDVTSVVKTSADANYAGTWPVNTAWLSTTGTTPADLSGVPAAAKNTTAAKLKTFGDGGNYPSGAWASVTVDGAPGLAMTYTVNASKSQYVRLRGTNMPAAVPSETDADGNPLSDLFTNASDVSKLTIPCTVTSGTNVPPLGSRVPYTGATGPIDACPTHLPTVTNKAVNGNASYTGRMVAYDVAAWADLWFYSNPIYVEVTGSVEVFKYPL